MFQAGDVGEEAYENLLAMRGVQYFWVVLHACHAALFAFEGCDGGAFGVRGCGKAFWGLVDGVAVAHPDFVGGVEAFVEDSAVDHHVCAAVFADAGVGDNAAEGVGHRLEAVADTEYGNTKFKDFGIEFGCAVFVHRGGST